MYVLQSNISDALREQFEYPRDKCAFTGLTSDTNTASLELYWIFHPKMCKTACQDVLKQSH